MFAKLISLLTALLLGCSITLSAEDAIFSGPQPGEKLPGFTVLATSGPNAGREVDFIAEYGGAPTMVMFVHLIDRNVFQVIWPLDHFFAEREKAGMKALFVFLFPNQVEGERRMQQVNKAMNLRGDVGISIEGMEGPGAYGLNKNVAVTVIVANDGEVVSNRVVTQGSVSDAQKVIHDLTKLVGGKVPSDLILARGAMSYDEVLAGPPPEKIEAALAEDPDDLAQILVRLTATKYAFDRARRDLLSWVGDDSGRKGYLAGRIPEILEIIPGGDQRNDLMGLREELTR